MRPPTRRHHWAVLILLAVVAINTWLTWQQLETSGRQANALTEVYKQRDPGLFPNDGLFADPGPGAVWRLHLPAWNALLHEGLRLGADDPLVALRLVGALTLMLYLLAMYLLLYRQTHSTSAATFVAVMSMAVFSTHRTSWGAGPLASVGPQTLFLAAVPLLLGGFLRTRRKRRVLLVFFLTGLCGNIHLSSAVNLVAVMLVALLGLGRFRPAVWATALLCLAVAAVGASPAIYHYHVVSAAGGQAGQVNPNVVWDAIKAVGQNTLYPHLLRDALRWLPLGAMLALPAAIILSRAGRYRLGDLGGWLWLLGASGIVAFGLTGLVQLGGHLLGWLPRRVELYDALRLATLPLYVLFAQAMVHLLRLARTNRARIKAALGVLLLVYLGAAYNTSVLRHLAEKAFTSTRQGDRAGRPAGAEATELRALGLWAAAQTPPEALFVTPNEEIRLYGRRSLLACPADFAYLYHLAPYRLRPWLDRLARQQQLLTPPESARAKPDQVAAFVDSCWKNTGRVAAPTFVLIPAASAPAPDGRLAEVAPPPPSQWGNYWRVYRVLPPAPATATASATTDTAPAPT